MMKCPTTIAMLVYLMMKICYDVDSWNGENDCSDDSDCGSASSTDEISDDDVSDYSPNGDGHQLQTNDNACVGDIYNSKESEENSDDRRPGVMIVKMAMHQMMEPTSQ